jgi:hypothetical protein
VLSIIRRRIYMVLCGYCRKDVKPKMYLTWKGFICGLGIFYLIYNIIKVPQCPNCNFPMPRMSMVLAIQPPQSIIKLARTSLLQLTDFRDRVISASLWPYLNHKNNPSQHFANMNTDKTTSFNLMANEIHSSIGLGNYRIRK